MLSVCVYCSSSDTVEDVYTSAAEALGRGIGQRGGEVVYGGGKVGLMGTLAHAAQQAGAPVTGIIPEKLQHREGISYDDTDTLIVTDTMRERKRIMSEKADAFVVLPGGYGTLEEFMEVLTLKQLGYHDRPIALVNVNGFFDTLLSFFEELNEGQFTHGRAVSELVHVVPTVDGALDRLEAVIRVDGSPT